jgi:hypothetical protein
VQACRTLGEKRNAFKNFVGKPGGKRALVRPRRRWEHHIEMVVI